MAILHHTQTCIPIWLMLMWMCGSSVLTNSGAGIVSSSRPQKLQNLLNSLRNYSKPDMDFSGVSKQTQNQSLITSTTISSNIPMPPLESHSNATTTNSSSFPPPSSSVNTYEDFYRVFYGSEEGVNHLKSQYGPNQLHRARSKFGSVKDELENVKKTNDHFLRIRTRARCKEPAPRIIRVKDYYPDPSREYLPRCTLLHVCSDSTGCCDSDAFHCTATEMQEVTLTFYTLTVGKNGLTYREGNGIEKLLFVNHTSCDCLPVNDLPRIQAEAPPDGPAPDSEENPLKSHRNKPKCRECPVPFSSRIYRNGRCGCDCFDRQKPCLRIKRGRDKLSEVERRCVEGNYCNIPDCEHGVFDSRSGFCPRRHDDERHQSRTHNEEKSETPIRHRWSYRERD